MRFYERGCEKVAAQGSTSVGGRDGESGEDICRWLSRESWLATEAFREAYRAARLECLRHSTARLQQAAAAAVD